MALSHFRSALVAVVLTLGAFAVASFAQDDGSARALTAKLVGRWDLVVHAEGRDFPSWLSIERSGKSYVGYYVGEIGSMRPVGKVHIDGGRFHFSVPPQFEQRTTDVTIEGALDGDGLKGEMVDENGRRLKWEGKRAPKLVRDKPPVWGESIALFNGQDLSGWKSRAADGKHGWVVKDGAMFNEKPGQDILTEQKFEDFKLHVEFRYPKGSNSGVYLRGRYECQIEDNFGRDPDSHRTGGVYGWLTPRINAVKPAGEWQTLDVTIVGREITLALNGEEIITRQSVPGITGGCLDSDEGAPGPLMLQGDHGPIEYRKIEITPAKSAG